MKQTRHGSMVLAGCMSAALAAGLIGGGVGPASAANTKIIVNNHSSNADVRIIDGSAYVRLSDVARAMGMAVVRRPDGYELKAAGGTQQIEGARQGRLGEVLFDGRWRFQVLSMLTPGQYILQHPNAPDYAVYHSLTEYDPNTHVMQPKDGNQLVVLHCSVTNGRNRPYALWVASGDMHTALADTQGVSHPPVVYDLAGAPTQSSPLLPGAHLEFNLVFSVPQGTTPKDLVFTLRTVDNRDGMSDVRVSLPQ